AKGEPPGVDTMHRRTLLTAVFAFLPLGVLGNMEEAAPPPQETREVRLNSPDRWQLSSGAMFSFYGHWDFVELKPSTLLSHELGTTDHQQTESLTAEIQAKKTFQIDDADVSEATLYSYGSAKKVQCNGKALTPEPVPSTGWSQVKLPAKALKRGV